MWSGRESLLELLGFVVRQSFLNIDVCLDRGASDDQEAVDVQRSVEECLDGLHGCLSVRGHYSPCFSCEKKKKCYTQCGGALDIAGIFGVLLLRQYGGGLGLGGGLGGSRLACAELLPADAGCSCGSDTGDGGDGESLARVRLGCALNELGGDFGGVFHEMGPFGLRSVVIFYYRPCNSCDKNQTRCCWA